MAAWSIRNPSRTVASPGAQPPCLTLLPCCPAALPPRRVPWEAEGIFDGISQYKLDNHGRIFEHQVDNIVLRDPPMQNVSPLLAGLNLMPMPVQQPYPGEGPGSATAQRRVDG
jgi:hypothetical protein